MRAGHFLYFRTCWFRLFWEPREHPRGSTPIRIMVDPIVVMRKLIYELQLTWWWQLNPREYILLSNHGDRVCSSMEVHTFRKGSLGTSYLRSVESVFDGLPKEPNPQPQVLRTKGTHNPYFFGEHNLPVFELVPHNRVFFFFFYCVPK